MHLHHVSIRTADIFRAITFYEHLGFEVETRFTTGITLACWMRGSWGRLELIQIPEPQPAPDAFGDPHYVGYYHLSLAVDHLDGILDGLVQKAGAKILLPPTLQTIAEQQYRVAFVADSDGLPIELMEPLEPAGPRSEAPGTD